MPLKFAANISSMFQEIPSILGRFKAASDAGFKFVECMCPYDESAEKLAEARKEAGVQQVLLNSYPGNFQAGDRGLAAISSKRKEFRESIELTIKYANALDCKRVHVMAGLHPAFEDTMWMEIYQENLRYAADRLQSEGILALIEAINTRISIPKYYLDHPTTALECVKKVNHPNLKLQFDVFHCQIMDGNLTSHLKESFPYIGHVQISQVPKRNEPGFPGEINYAYILGLLDEMGYDGYVGLEYYPTGDTVEGLTWMKDLNVTL